tara:strand:- start:113 stop:406 length:294 start_codon:yes stop_codon:yes gene_type:complete
LPSKKGILQPYTPNLPRLAMALLNLWSLGHFLQWALIGRFFSIGWPLFFVLSIGWEGLELLLPYEFTSEEWSNKISDVFVNAAGFYLGRSHKDANEN